ncbi:hypothetical protein [Limnochorda pilosa]|uniref:Uncharacterized protein n=1 Tax=Limnochorda pilosa TaxID=1555112 RepID=A0A0K2SQ59_LIMPI|nr:hypothetical protein [Limnochorda pilosa]BAS29255.1 hypothetical protein LIP_3443 [Limnochorda pilosa]
MQGRAPGQQGEVDPMPEMRRLIACMLRFDPELDALLGPNGLGFG